MKKRIYSVECKQVRKKIISIEAEDENEAGNIVDDMLSWGEIDFNTNSSYKEDFNIRPHDDEKSEGPYRVLTEEEKAAAFKVAYEK